MNSKELQEKISAAENGPTYKILKKLKLEVGGNSNIFRKVIFFSLITWLPLLIITLLEGTALENIVKIPFLYDYGSYFRFLVALPMLFVAEKFIRFETSNSLCHFVESGIISENNISNFEKIIHKYDKLQSSKSIELILFILAYVKIILSGMFFMSYGDESTWKYILDDGRDWNYAGYWFLFISFPIYQFFAFRLIWKFLIWSWFLWKISNMNLNLVASDPDRSAGLGFLGTVQSSFGLLGFAQAVAFSSEIANKIIYGGSTLDDFIFTTLISIILVVIIYLSPMFFFTRKLLKLKLKAMMDYSNLTHSVSFGFDNKWVKGTDSVNDDRLLGGGDISSLADLRNAYEVVEDMRIVPFTIRVPLFMILLIVIPFLPLLTLKFPLNEILITLAGFIF